ncbi:hypothetical protein M0208_07910 [Sphingomonas sp. SUN019]|uniref:hypothetical protein n=1 Tax=Sphingomonas sp. SUN019 TaxID=2937788 RepID=UPI002164AA46|nr:hypothetical protein [Sphingomonas sp. SUN019]UVO50444.1 hypothetical protein M0208_07910 [Sphingomonas sp. SUN019]
MTNHRSKLVLALVTLAMPVTAAQAQDKRAVPTVMQKVLDCRALTDSAARLACYDAGVAALESARAGGEVAVFDREDVRKTKRGLFGFSLSDLPIFGKRDKENAEEERDEVKEITATMKAVTRNSAGGFIVTLEDGARWEQTDSTMLGRSPRVGETVTIKRAALGSYKMSFKTGPSVRARRTG